MEIIFQIIILIFSVVIHEVSHGLIAYWLGDLTAKYAGRLTLNPIKHLDPWGSVFIPLLLVLSGTGIIFGWAKPVPYNPYNLKDQKYGPALVGFAGPLSNIVVALLAGTLMRILLIFQVDDQLIIYPFLTYVIMINILLAVFNLLPIPPLDGSKLLFSVLPISEHTKALLEQYGFLFLIVFLILFSKFFSIILFYALKFFSNYIVGVNIFSFISG